MTVPSDRYATRGTVDRTAPLCIAEHCHMRGRHVPDCADERCRGCQPHRAADGLRLCYGHAEWIATDATTAAELYNVLAERLAGTGMRGEQTSGSRDPGLKFNDRAADVRTLIRHRLVSWTLLIAEERGFNLPTRRYLEHLPPGFIGPPRLLAEVDDTEQALGEFIARSALWLAAHPAAADASAEFDELVRLARPIAYPTGTRTFDVAPCLHHGCEGTIRAVLRRVDSLLPSALVCDVDEEHTWPADQWLTLGRKLKRAA